MTEGQGQEETEMQGTQNSSSSTWGGGGLLPAPRPYCHILQGLTSWPEDKETPEAAHLAPCPATGSKSWLGVPRQLHRGR